MLMQIFKEKKDISAMHYAIGFSSGCNISALFGVSLSTAMVFGLVGLICVRFIPSVYFKK